MIGTVSRDRKAEGITVAGEEEKGTFFADQPDVVDQNL
jgi:hypothetical protein